MRHFLAALLIVFAFVGHARAQDNCGASQFSQSFNPQFPGCGNFVLDKLAVKPGLAFSLRQLSASYTGPLINVERTSDSTFKDIYASNGVLNQGQLMAFCAGTTCGVDDWYNQGALGSSGNATQTTAANQPVIVASGVVETQNGTPTVLFGSFSFLSNSGYTPFLSTPTVFNAVLAASTALGFPSIVANGTSGVLGGVVDFGLLNTAPNYYVLYEPGGGQYNFSAFASTGNMQIISLLSNGLSAGTWTGTLYTNGASAGSGSVSGFGVQPTGIFLGSNGLSGKISEIVAPAFADRHILELNQAQFYSIAGVQ